IHISTRACLALGGLLLLLGVLVIFAMSRGFSRPQAKPGRSSYSGSVAAKNSVLPNTPDGETLCAPGPWGSLAFVRMSIEIPDEYISAHLHESVSTRWLFRSYTPEKLTALLTGLDLSANARAELLDHGKWTVKPDGIAVAPSSQTVLSLSKAARSSLYN